MGCISLSWKVSTVLWLVGYGKTCLRGWFLIISWSSSANYSFSECGAYNLFLFWVVILTFNIASLVITFCLEDSRQWWRGMRSIWFMPGDGRSLRSVFCQGFLGQSEFGSCHLWYSCHNERVCSLFKKSQLGWSVHCVKFKQSLYFLLYTNYIIDNFLFSQPFLPKRQW